ncbi:YebC-like protein [Zopfia rhizophila CBS 207.26]|uniref:YebC-like protein n=1 Tax=Zopfia rhizophila CBS 207.26 TaxID=1314779 RepID=A0A6A6DL93_9PEZI|nr:YebC-like protein [Zopfia rhizophila CBS 207.26]
MSAPPRRLIGGTLSLEKFTRCVCRRPGWSPNSQHGEHSLGWQSRCLSSSVPVWSGHSKWATIKHDKGKNDAAKSKQRSIMTKDISNAVKLAGPDPNTNPRLALAISTAKKNAVPKASIESAIARGQGISATGAALESVVLEAMLPPSVATVIECQTDNKLRALADLRLIVKEAGGTVSPIGYLFEKKGRIIFQKKDGIGVDEVLEAALEAGALDVVEDDHSRVVLYTEPAQTKTTAESLAKALELEIAESEIIYDPNEDTKVSLDDEEAAKELSAFLDEVQEVTGIQAVYTNWSKGAISDELWSDLQSKVAL